MAEIAVEMSKGCTAIIAISQPLATISLYHSFICSSVLTFEAYPSRRSPTPMLKEEVLTPPAARVDLKRTLREGKGTSGLLKGTLEVICFSDSYKIIRDCSLGSSPQNWMGLPLHYIILHLSCPIALVRRLHRANY